MLSQLKIIFLSIVCLALLSSCTTTNPHFTEQARTQKFIDKMVYKHGFSRSELEDDFARAKIRHLATRSVKAPLESNPWLTYQRAFITPTVIRQGAAFWHAHAETLARAEKTYGVPPEIIVAILGVETHYGRAQGTFSVFDVLATLAFYYPPRAAFFESELEQFLLLTRELDLPPNNVRGSYAGAIGIPQFMPSNYRAYAIDTDNKGHSDLMRNPNDAIFSVANYFRHHGWQPGQPVAARARVIGDHELPPTGLAHKMSLAKLRAYGIVPSRPFPSDMRASVIALQGGHGQEFWLGFQNFHSITRYNHSALYAMAVYQLSQRVRAAY
jgi:membrane-bound lytic murein transglycosylase B